VLGDDAHARRALDRKWRERVGRARGRYVEPEEEQTQQIREAVALGKEPRDDRHVLRSRGDVLALGAEHHAHAVGVVAR
jgi:hypothetical protein